MKELLSNLNSILKKEEKRKTGVLIGLMFLSALLEVCGISTVLPIISALLDKNFMYTNAYAVRLCRWCGIGTYESFVILSVSLLLAVFLVKNAVLILKCNYQAKFALRFQYKLRRRVFHTYLKKEYPFYFEHNSSDIYRTLMDDVAKTYTSFDGLLHIITETVVNLFLVGAIFVIDWRLSLGMLAVIGVVLCVISGIIRPIVRKRGEIAYAAARKRNKWIHESLQGIKTVKVTEKDSFFEEKAYRCDLEFSKSEQYHMVLSSIPRMIIELFSMAALVIIIAVLVLRGDSFAMLIPKIGAIGMAVLRVLPGANATVSRITSMQYRMPAIKRIAELMQEREAVVPTGAFPVKYEECIEVERVSFRYGEKSNYILHEASLCIPIGKMIGIVGVSGEGKTTFVDILLGLLPTEKGRITVDGTDIYQNLVRWRESIGYITQHIFLLDDSIRANVAFGVEDSDISDEKIWDALEKAQLADFVRSLPEGIHTRIGEKGVKLSGGQRQRVGIARALYHDPQILIFDEATSSLDTDTERGVVDAINSLYGKHTIIVIAHRSAALERCDSIYRMKNGAFVKD